MKKVLSLVGARPQFIKEAVINEAVRNADAWDHVLVNSGQHYDFNMAGTFFDELGIPVSRYNMGVGSGTHAEQTAEAMCKFEKILTIEKPDIILLYGDTNTTLAGAITASKLRIPIAHVEAGPRTFVKSIPEEINRILTDKISDLLFCATELNVENLKNEGIVEGVFNTGDVMYDLYNKMANNLDPENEMKKYGLLRDQYILVTLHRDFNTDVKEVFEYTLRGLILAIEKLKLKAIFPMHPRARKRAAEFGLDHLLEKFIVTEPLGYMEIMSLLQTCRFVITDSGGFQKESYWSHKRGVLIVPGGWPEISSTGWHILVKDPLKADWESLTTNILKPYSYPANIFGDGKAAEKITRIICKYLS